MCVCGGEGGGEVVISRSEKKSGREGEGMRGKMNKA